MIQQTSPILEMPPELGSNFNVETVFESVDEHQALALQEWLRLSDGDDLPLRTALKPERIVKALPVSSFVTVDWRTETPRFQARIEGQLVTIAFGEARGRTFTESYAPDHLAQVLPAFWEAAHRGRVTLTQAKTKTSEGETFLYSRLLLPFADSDGKVVRILAVYGFDIDQLHRLNEPLDIGDVIPATSKRRQAPASFRLKSA